jgi:GNAT superfamily N-acetyltransferase
VAVRRAEPGDLARIADMVEDMRRESVYRDMPANRPKMEAFLGHLLQNPATVLFVAVDSGGEISGFYAGRIGDYWFSDAKAAFDIIFYVRPDRRGGRAALELWKAFSDWGRSMGAVHVWPSISSGIAPDRFASFYQKLGMEPVGGVFLGRL